MSIPSHAYFGPDAIGPQIKAVAKTWDTARLHTTVEGRGEFERVVDTSQEFPIHAALHEIYREAFGVYGTGWKIDTIINARLELWDSDGEILGDQVMRVAPAENGSFDLFFSDDSTVSAYAFRFQEVTPDTSSGDTKEKERSPRRDDGISLLEPITAEEYGVIETVIGLLQKMVDSETFDEAKQLRLQGALALLIDTHREAVVGETKRHELWAVTKRVMHYFFKELPGDITTWVGVVTIIKSVWPTLGEFLRSL